MEMPLCYGIRDASSDDAACLSEIEKLCFSMPWSQKSLSDFIQSDNTVMLIAETENKLTGYAGAYVLIDEADITNVAVLSQYRNNGIGEALLRALEVKLLSLGILSITLEVRASNTPAKKLYQKLCYQEVGIRRGYYQFPREDAIIMKKIL